MNFIKQIKQEMKLITSTKFLLIIAAVLLVFSILYPLMGRFFLLRMIYSGSSENADPASITIRGVTIDENSPLYYSFETLEKTINVLETDSGSVTTDPKVKKMALDLTDENLEFCRRASAEIKDYNDYRTDAVYFYMRALSKKKLLEADRADLSAMRRAVEIVVTESYLSDEDFNAQYANISASQKRETLEKVNKQLEDINYMLNDKDAADSFDKYIDLLIAQNQDEEQRIQLFIEALEREIIAHPGSEEQNGMQIEDYEIDLEMIRIENDILNLRRERKIDPSDGDDWRNNAIYDIKNNQQSIVRYGKLLSEEEFAADRWMTEDYGTYQKYEKAVQDQVNKYNNNILIAQNSLNADKPDMKYVDNGARASAHSFLISSETIFLFAVLIGGWLIANEHQSGTIRLLLIRPKTRTKILMSKYLSALVFCFMLYTLTHLLCMLTAGISSGFGDFLYPNYTVSGPVNFFSIYLSRFVICFLPVVFMLTFSFMLSVLLKNMALSIVIPFGLYIGTSVLRGLMSVRAVSTDYLAYFPFRYLSFSDVFGADSDMLYASMGMYMPTTAQTNVTLGIAVLLLYSAAALIISVIAFRKQDVQN